MISYRHLNLADVRKVAEIDRSELIDGIYTARDGNLTLHDKHIDVKGWNRSQVQGFVESITKAMADRGAAFGAFDGDRLVGIAGLRTGPVGGDPNVMQLDPLHISAPFRNLGIGKRLVSMVSDRAKSLGAKALYISATPSRNTVDAYRKMGASVLTVPDPVLFALEPEDVHLLLPLRAVGDFER